MTADIDEPREGDSDTAAKVIEAAALFQDPLRRLVSAAKDDPGAPFAPDALKLLAELRRTDKPRFEGIRAALKRAGIRVTALDEALDEEDGDPARRDTQATVLAKLAAERAALFHRADGAGFADIEVNGHRETWPVRSKGFRAWLARLFFNEVGGVANGEAVQAALGLIEARCQFDGDERPVFLRVGGAGGNLYLDLCNPSWQAVEIDAEGWRVVDRPPVRFRRAAGMLALPVPERGGSIADLRPFLNGNADEDFTLAAGWLLAALRERGPYPVLAIAGEQGSAKSTFTKVLRSLVDPNAAPLRALPREDRDLFIAATNGHTLAFDNISGLPHWISDTLCRLATGGGFAVRQLYTDQDETLFDAQRPVILNGIEDFVARPDLGDRAIMLTLEAIPETARRPEDALWAAFERARPRILGALLDAVAHGLRELPRTKLARLPRMADFALRVSACDRVLWAPGTFMAAYSGNRAEAVEIAVEHDALAREVRTLAVMRTQWTGNATDLLGALNDQAGERVTRAKDWPACPKALSGRLRRVAPVLRKVGVAITFTREGRARARTVTIAFSGADTGGNFASASSAPSAEAKKARDDNGLGADANRGGADANAGSYRPQPTHWRDEENGRQAADADDADANSPPFVGAEKIGTPGEPFEADDDALVF
jgi:hypothetical protein